MRTARLLPTWSIATLILLAACKKEGTEEPEEQPQEPAWSEVTGLYGGSFTELATNGEKVMAIGESDFLYTSADHGQTWPNSIGIGWYHRGLFINGTTLFIGMWDLRRSGDNGTSWHPCDDGIPPNTPYHSMVRVGDDLYAGTAIGIFRSSDDGFHWTDVSYNLSGSGFIELAASGTTIFAIVGTGGVYAVCSMDVSGTAWNNLYSLSGAGLSLAASGSTVLVGTTNGALRSTNNGQDWGSAGLAAEEVNALMFTGTDVFAGTASSGLYRSADNGTTWSPVPTGIPADANVQCLVADGTTLYAGTLIEGLFTSSDGGDQWVKARTQLRIEALAGSGTELFAASHAGGVHHSGDGGSSWATMSNGLPGNYAVSGFDIGNGRIYAAVPGGIYYATLGGGTWYLLGGDATMHCVSIRGDTLIAGTEQAGIRRSIDGGASWQPAVSGLPSSATIYAAHAGNGFLLAGGYGDGIYRSVDAGETWVHSDAPNVTYVWDFVEHGSAVFASTHQGVFMSTDSGSTWIAKTNGLDLYWPYDAIISSGSTLFTAYRAYGLVYYSSNNGENWTASSTNLPALWWSSLAISGSDLFIGGAHGDGGLWRRSL